MQVEFVPDAATVKLAPFSDTLTAAPDGSTTFSGEVGHVCGWCSVGDAGHVPGLCDAMVLWPPSFTTAHPAFLTWVCADHHWRGTCLWQQVCALLELFREGAAAKSQLTGH